MTDNTDADSDDVVTTSFVTQETVIEYTEQEQVYVSVHRDHWLCDYSSTFRRLQDTTDKKILVVELQRDLNCKMPSSSTAKSLCRPEEDEQPTFGISQPHINLEYLAEDDELDVGYIWNQLGWGFTLLLLQWLRFDIRTLFGDRMPVPVQNYLDMMIMRSMPRHNMLVGVQNYAFGICTFDRHWMADPDMVHTMYEQSIAHGHNDWIAWFHDKHVHRSLKHVEFTKACVLAIALQREETFVLIVETAKKLATTELFVDLLEIQSCCLRAAFFLLPRGPDQEFRKLILRHLPLPSKEQQKKSVLLLCEHELEEYLKVNRGNDPTAETPPSPLRDIDVNFEQLTWALPCGICGGWAMFTGDFNKDYMCHYCFLHAWDKFPEEDLNMIPDLDDWVYDNRKLSITSEESISHDIVYYVEPLTKEDGQDETLTLPLYVTRVMVDWAVTSTTQVRSRYERKGAQYMNKTVLQRIRSLTCIYGMRLPQFIPDFPFNPFLYGTFELRSHYKLRRVVTEEQQQGKKEKKEKKKEKKGKGNRGKK